MNSGNEKDELSPAEFLAWKKRTFCTVGQAAFLLAGLEPVRCLTEGKIRRAGEEVETFFRLLRAAIGDGEIAAGKAIFHWESATWVGNRLVRLDHLAAWAVKNGHGVPDGLTQRASSESLSDVGGDSQTLPGE